jgi:hypothetical protein
MTDEERHAKAQAYGEAMRAMCEHCRGGIPTVFAFYFGGECGEAVWHEHADGNHSPCQAAPIHALVDTLVQESVAS